LKIFDSNKEFSVIKTKSDIELFGSEAELDIELSAIETE
jgi:hypothetical protein